MSKGSFIKSSLIYTIGDMLPKVITFFMIPILTKYLTSGDYGIVNIVTTAMGLFSMLYLVGMDGALARFYYKYKNENKEKSFLGTLWMFLFLYNGIVTVLLIYLGKPISNTIFKSVPYNPFFKLMIVNCFLISFTTMPMIVFRLKEQAAKFGLFNVLNTLVYVFFIYYFVSYLKQGAEGNLKAYVYTSIIFAGIYFILMVKDFKFRFSFSMLNEALKYGIPLIPHAIGGWVLMMSDRWFLERYRTPEEIGVYSLAYQFGLLVYYMISAINKAYVPFFFKTAEETDNAPAIFSDILKYYSVFILTIGFGIALFSKEIILIMASNKSYYEAYKVIPIIALAYVFEGHYFMSINSIFYAKKTHVLAVTTGITAVTAIILNYILIPRFGIYGAATATAVAYFVLSLITYFNAQKFYYIKWNWKSILLNGGIGLVLYLISVIEIKSLLVSVAFKLTLTIVYFVALFGLKILSYSKLLYILNKLIKKR